MNEDLKLILFNKKFTTMFECIEFLNLAGYSARQCFEISCDLFNGNWGVETKNLDAIELELYEILKTCYAIPYDKNNEIFYHVGGNNSPVVMEPIFSQWLSKRKFLIDYYTIINFFRTAYTLNIIQTFNVFNCFVKTQLKLKDYEIEYVGTWETPFSERVLMLKSPDYYTSINPSTLLEI